LTASVTAAGKLEVVITLGMANGPLVADNLNQAIAGANTLALTAANPTSSIDTFLDKIVITGFVTKVSGKATYDLDDSSTFKAGEGTITWAGTITPAAGYLVPEEDTENLSTLADSIKNKITTADTVGYNKVKTLTANVVGGELVVVITLEIVEKELDADLLNAASVTGTTVTLGSTVSDIPAKLAKLVSTIGTTNKFTVAVTEAPTGTLTDGVGEVTIKGTITPKANSGYTIPASAIDASALGTNLAAAESGKLIYAIAGRITGAGNSYKDEITASVAASTGVLTVVITLRGPKPLSPTELNAATLDGISPGSIGDPVNNYTTDQSTFTALQNVVSKITSDAFTVSAVQSATGGPLTSFAGTITVTATVTPKSAYANASGAINTGSATTLETLITAAFTTGSQAGKSKITATTVALSTSGTLTVIFTVANDS
jgi:hypothetical protein